jgi:hypothetical protein
MPPAPDRPASIPSPPPPTPTPPKATGPRFVVHGVAAPDVLNMRAGPSSKDAVVGTIPPDASGVIAVGRRRQMGPSVWREVSYGGVHGWVNARFLVEERARPRSR